MQNEALSAFAWNYLFGSYWVGSKTENALSKYGMLNLEAVWQLSPKINVIYLEKAVPYNALFSTTGYLQ